MEPPAPSRKATSPAAVRLRVRGGAAPDPGVPPDGQERLEGRQVGVNRGYTVTTGVWARGILQDEYDVDLSHLTPGSGNRPAGLGSGPAQELSLHDRRPYRQCYLAVTRMLHVRRKIGIAIYYRRKGRDLFLQEYGSVVESQTLVSRSAYDSNYEKPGTAANLLHPAHGQRKGASPCVTPLEGGSPPSPSAVDCSRQAHPPSPRRPHRHQQLTA